MKLQTILTKCNRGSSHPVELTKYKPTQHVIQTSYISTN